VKYRTIVADPPWPYDKRPIGGARPGEFGQARPFPYPTMSLSDIALLPVDDLAEDDAALWLWTTNRYLRAAFDLIAEWGFRYRQTLVWGKNNPMPVGAVAPSAAEFLLFAKRGKPEMGWAFPSSVIVTARPAGRRHSTKPECFMDWIEACSPAERLEMFARRNRLGWDTWGNESLEHVSIPTRSEEL
jgi:N6-adenosine-specific RNA methylase IME4